MRLSDGRRHSLTSNSSTLRKKRRKADLHLQIQEIKNLETTSSSEEEVDQEVVVETEEVNVKKIASSSWLNLASPHSSPGYYLDAKAKNYRKKLYFGTYLQLISLVLFSAFF